MHAARKTISYSNIAPRTCSHAHTVLARTAVAFDTNRICSAFSTRSA